MNISNIGTFYFLSLGILFVLCCLLVYHFKRRLDLFEQKNDTIFEIVNNVLAEISSIKQKQNVLFMLAKSTPPPTEGGAVEKDLLPIDDSSKQVNICTRVVETNIHKNVIGKEKKKNVDEDAYENYDDEENYEEEEEEEEDADENEEDNGDEDEDEDEDGNEMNDMIHKFINYHTDSVGSNNIKKIKVVDDDEKIIDLTNNDNEETNQMSFTSHFNGYYEKNGSNNGLQNDSHNHMLDIDMSILNLHSLHQLHSNIFQNNSQPDLNIQILNDVDQVKDLDNIVEVLDEDEEIYKDMPELESIEDNTFLTSIDSSEKTIEVAKVDIDESVPVEYLDDAPTHVQNAANTKKEADTIQTNEQSSEEVEIDVQEPSVDKLPTTEPTDETISEDGFNFKKSEKLGRYRKLSVQALRELVVSNGVIQDASKLKKGEILMLLQNSL